MCQNLNKKEEVGGHAVGATSISRSQGSHALNQTLLYQPFYSGTWVHKLCSEGLFLISSHAIRLFLKPVAMVLSTSAQALFFRPKSSVHISDTQWRQLNRSMDSIWMSWDHTWKTGVVARI